MKHIVLGILTIFVLSGLGMAQSENEQGPSAPGKKGELALKSLDEGHPFFTVKVKNEELLALIWQCQVDYRNYLCAMGKAKINPDLQIGNSEITVADVQMSGVFDEAQKDALSKLNNYLGKNFHLEFSVYQNLIYVSQDKQWFYVVGMVPIAKPISLNGLPDFLKRSDRHALALVLEGNSRGHKSIYALGLAQTSPKIDAWERAIDLAIKDGEKKLSQYLRRKNPSMTYKLWSNPAQAASVAWALVQARVE